MAENEILDDETLNKRLKLKKFLTTEQKDMIITVLRNSLPELSEVRIYPSLYDSYLENNLHNFDIMYIIKLIQYYYEEFYYNQNYGLTPINFFNRFNQNVFLDLVDNICQELIKQPEILTFTELKEMSKKELFNIHFYKSDDKKKIYIASPETYEYMKRNKRTMLRGTFKLIDNEILSIVCRFLKIGASEPMGFKEKLWIDIAKKILEIEGIKCDNVNENLSYFNITDIHNKTLKERNERIMEEANRGGGKSKKLLYENLTVKALQQLCLKHKISYSGLRKAELIKILNTYKIKP